MFYNKLKIFVKKNFPALTKKFINFRDNNYVLRLIKNFYVLKVNKNIHGKKIVSQSGYILSYSRKNYISHTIRPKKLDNFFLDDFNNDDNDTSIIIQGGLKGINSFVEESLNIYLTLFKNSNIILSTWNDEISDKFINKFKDKIHIIKNNKPINFSHNLDLQIISTANGIKKANELGSKYCLKTRTDCRIYEGKSIKLCKNLIKAFPINEKYKNLNSRIISCAVDTRKYRVYGLSDILMFGETKNMSKYFLKEEYERSLKIYDFGSYPCIIKDTAVINEIFLCARFLKNLGCEMNWTLEDWWKKCSEIFCIIDPSYVDFFWYKYHWKFEQRFLKNYTSNFKQSLSFADWLDLYIEKDFTTNTNHEKLKEKWKIKDGLIVQ